jgi:hypothetical protein
MRYSLTGAAALTLASTIAVQASPFPDPFDRRYADHNAGSLADSRAGILPNLARRQAVANTPPANLPNATGLSYAVPPPNSNGGKAWKEAHSRAVDLVAQMTLKEKVSSPLDLDFLLVPLIDLPLHPASSQVGIVTGQIGR